MPQILTDLILLVPVGGAEALPWCPATKDRSIGGNRRNLWTLSYVAARTKRNVSRIVPQHRPLAWPENAVIRPAVS